MQEKKFKLLLQAAVIAAVALFLILFFVVVFQFFELSASKREEKRKQRLLTEMLQYDADLRAGIESAQSAKFIEEYAREILGWGKQGEIYYIYGK